MSNACPRIFYSPEERRAQKAKEVELFEKEVKAFLERAPEKVFTDVVIEVLRTSLVYIGQRYPDARDDLPPIIAQHLVQHGVMEALFVLSADGPNHYHHNAILANLELRGSDEVLLKLKVTAVHEEMGDAAVLGVNHYLYDADHLISSGLPYAHYRQLVVKAIEQFAQKENKV